MSPGGRKPGPQGPHRPSTPVRAENCLARVGLTMADAAHMTDGDLLAIPNLGQESLDYIRSFDAGPRIKDSTRTACPHCGQSIMLVQGRNA